MRDNKAYGNKLILFGLLLNTNLYRTVAVNVTNLRITDIEVAPFTPVYFYGTPLITLYYSDSIHDNYSARVKLVAFGGFAKVVMKS